MDGFAGANLDLAGRVGGDGWVFVVTGDAVHWVTALPVLAASFWPERQVGDGGG